jgi:hypothetical protein
VVDILTTKFILAVKQGVYKHIQPTWLQMKENSVRKRCQSKLYRMQHICLKPQKCPNSDKINQMDQRWQEVSVLLFILNELLTSGRHITEDGRSTTQTTTGTQEHGPASGYYSTRWALWVLVTMRLTIIPSCPLTTTFPLENST